MVKRVTIRTLECTINNGTIRVEIGYLKLSWQIISIVVINESMVTITKITR